ncbi:acyl CoA:acetate/3-ketoacid CoA transferase [Cupriavidus sp. a3]|uniref:acyl CoA:acetate/3-ketoacid CoA transferase n=1 Tax=Cupriavidus sp. a3 TaxID=3242158 RepID=UPI003D9C6653
MTKIEISSASAAAALIKDGDTVAVAGNGAGMGSAEEILAAIEKRFLDTGHPRNLTLVHSLGLGDRDQRGINRLAHEGLVAKVIAGHFTWSPRMQQLIREEKLEAYSFPAGVIQQLLREIGAGRPGLFTETGLGTFADPRHDGGACNARSKDQLVELMQVDGKDILRYKPFKVDVAIVRGTYADSRGNISPEEEPMDLDLHTMALAASNSGGLVLAQVRQVVEAGTLNPRNIRIPAIMVDYVVEAPNQEQFYGLGYDMTVSGSRRAQLGSATADLPAKLERRIIARRAAMEIVPGASLNFGFGIPGGIFGVIAEQGIGDQLWMSVEQGVHNGRMLDDALFGAARNPEVILPSIEQFDFYSGGGIDVAFLGMGEVDAQGNVNVSHLGGNLIGPGGFVDITQNAKKVVFCGTLDAQGTKLAFSDGRLNILQPGKVRKFVSSVERITFSGEFAREHGREVLFVTDRAVFRLEKDGLTLIEVAPGVDIERDILAQMDFKPAVGEVKLMPPEVFR